MKVDGREAQQGGRYLVFWVPLIACPWLLAECCPENTILGAEQKGEVALKDAQDKLAEVEAKEDLVRLLCDHQAGGQAGLGCGDRHLPQAVGGQGGEVGDPEGREWVNAHQE